MRRIVLALAAVAAFGLAVPVVASTPADARDVVIIKKKHRDHGWHRGHHRKKIIVREGRRHHHHHRHGARVIIR